MGGFEWRYYHNHLVIASLMNVIIGGYVYVVLGSTSPLYLLSGGVFYGIREGIQYIQKHWWDSKGFWWPVLSSIALAVTSLCIHVTI